MEELKPPPLPPPEKPKQPKNSGSNLIIIGIVLVAVSVLGEGISGSKTHYSNIYEAAGAVMGKLFLFSAGAFLTLRGLRLAGKMKIHRRLFLTGGAFLFVTLYVAAFSFGMSINMDEEGLISEEPLINITKIISILSLIAAAIYFIKGIRLINPKK